MLACPHGQQFNCTGLSLVSEAGAEGGAGIRVAAFMSVQWLTSANNRCKSPCRSGADQIARVARTKGLFTRA